MNKPAKPKLTAEAAYENSHLVAQDLLERIREILQDLPAPGPQTNWGHVGDLAHANDLLAQVISHLGK
jgi:hypothetical protein